LEIILIRNIKRPGQVTFTKPQLQENALGEMDGMPNPLPLV